jgi:hypothetical protein
MKPWYKEKHARQSVSLAVGVLAPFGLFLALRAGNDPLAIVFFAAFAAAILMVLLFP